MLEGDLQDRTHKNPYIFKILRRHLHFAEFRNESHAHTHTFLIQRQNQK